MINIIFTLLLVILLIFSGKIVYAIKKLLSLITSYILKFLSFFGIKINKKEKHIKISDDFKRVYKDIKIMKLSKKNIKSTSSIDWLNLAVFLTAGLLVIFNLNVVTGNAISNWIYSIISNLKFIKSATDMNTLYTAVLFSTMSFSLSKLLLRWKETKQQRVERKQYKLKQEALQLMNSKELVDNARKKDDEKLKELKK